MNDYSYVELYVSRGSMVNYRYPIWMYAMGLIWFVKVSSHELNMIGQVHLT